MRKLPLPVPAPRPGSVVHAPVTARIVRPEPRTLSDEQLVKALAENAEAGDVDRLGELLGDPRPTRKRRMLDGALLAASRHGREAAVTLLLDAKANVNAPGIYGGPLALAIRHDVSLVRLLLARGAKPNGSPPGDDTPLHGAVEHGRLEVARALLEAGANPNAGGSMTPLHTADRASLEGDVPVEMIDLLVAHGADLERGPRTPLHWAVSDGLTAHVERLVACGANVNAREKRTRSTPLHFAFGRGNDALAEKLIVAGADRSMRNESGIDLREVYGAEGEDRRVSRVDYSASAEAQLLEVSLRVGVLMPVHLRGFYRADFDASFWARRLPELAPGARASVVKAIDLGNIGKPGVVEQRFALEVAAIPRQLVEGIATSLLKTTTTFTGAGHLAVLRVIAVAIRGSTTPSTAFLDRVM